MGTPIRALALALALALAAAARGQDMLDAKLPDPNPAESGGFPWLCFAASIAALGTLGFFVRRRERELGIDFLGCRKPDLGWYCRACNRDVTGSECPRCRAASPFIHE
jgi:uncharacterized RDD family membrane protein YckC